MEFNVIKKLVQEPIKNNFDNERLVEKYIADLNPNAKISYGSVLRMFLKHLDGKPILEVKRSDIKSYCQSLRARNLSAKTQKYHLGAIRSFYNYLCDEEILEVNPVGSTKSFIKEYKSKNTTQHQFTPSPEQAAILINNAYLARDKAIIALLFKTGLRRGEASALDLDSVDFDTMTIRIKDTEKRSYNYAFIDQELAILLKRWIARRGGAPGPLFIGLKGERLMGRGIYNIFTKLARASGIQTGGKHWSVHSTRYAFTTWLLSGKMSREHVQKLRGDSIKDAIDIYHHISDEELRKEYLRAMPILGVA
jgi:integrase/recombinase XerD